MATTMNWKWLHLCGPGQASMTTNQRKREANASLRPNVKAKDRENHKDGT